MRWRFQSQPVKIALETEIGHYRGDDAVALQAPGTLPVGGDQTHKLIAVQERAALVGDRQAVAVAIEGDAKISARRRHLRLHVLGVGRAAAAVDVEAVGIGGHRHHVGAELPQNGRRCPVACAVGAVHHDLEALKRAMLGEGALDELDVASLRVVEPLRPAEVARRGEPRAKAVLDVGFDLRLNSVGELVPVAREQLDPVVGEGVVRGRDHHAEVGAQAAG